MNAMDKTKIVALYVRVSTERQAEDGYTLEAQEKVLRGKVIDQEKVVFKVYKDAGISGATLDRPALMKLLDDAEKGCFGSVYVWSVDRVARNLLLFLNIVERLRRAGVELHSISESFDANTPGGKLLLGFLGSFAQCQRESIRTNTMMGSRKRAQSGKFLGGNMLGYKIVLDEADPKGRTKRVIEEREAVIVKTIFELYCSGLGLKATARRVNELGMRGKNGGKFSITTIRRILTNKAYIGFVKYENEYFQGIHEPIIDMETWEKAQALLSSKGSYAKVIDYQYMLSGLIKCPNCGWGMLPAHVTRKTKDGKVHYLYYYVCGQYMNKGRGSCTGKVVRAQEADTAVMNFLTRHLSSPAWKKAILAQIRKKFSANANDAVSAKLLKAALERLKNKQTVLLLKYEDGELDKDRLMEELSRIKTEIQLTETKLNSLDTGSLERSYDEKAIMNAFSKLPKLIEKAPVKDRIKLVRGIVKAVYIDSDRTVSEIEVYVPTLNIKAPPQTMLIKI